MQKSMSFKKIQKNRCFLVVFSTAAMWFAGVDSLTGWAGVIVDPADVCQGTTILGVSGAARCVVDTLTTQAGAGDILAGQGCWNVNGTLIFGTMSHNGTWDVRTAFPGAGFYEGLSNLPISSQVCTGSTIFGVSGAAICSSFANLFPSGMLRNINTTQITLSAQPGGTDSLPSGYRIVPSILKDDEGYDASSPMRGSGVAANTRKVVRGTSVWDGTVPRKVCGKAATSIAAKIADCATQHVSKPSWDGGVAGRLSWNGAVKGFRTEGSWTLVTVFDSSLSDGNACGTSCYEVWRDDKTGLIWSDNLGTVNWCKASGSNFSIDTNNPYREDDPSNYCDSAAYQNQTQSPAPESWCAEDTTWLLTPTAYDPMKGGLRLTGTPAVKWYLPTISDLRQAELNGIRFVLPQSNGMFWSSSTASSSRGGVWYFSGDLGSFHVAARFSSTTLAVRCVGK